MSASRSLQRMVSRVAGGRLAAVAILSLVAACGGERKSDATADSSAVATAASDTAGAVSPTDTVNAVLPDTSAKVSGSRDTTAAAAPGTSVTRSTGSQDSAAGTPAPKPAAPKPAAPKPAPKPAASDTAAKAPAPAPAAQAPAAPAPAAPAPAAPAPAAPAPSAQAPAAQPSQDAPLRDEYHQAPRDTVTQVVYDGWKQYNLNCARCHGEDVMGTTIAPHLVMSLKPDGPINTKESFVQVVCAGRPEKGMPAWCALGLEMDKIDAIYGYVKGRSAGEIGPGRPAVKSGG